MDASLARLGTHAARLDLVLEASALLSMRRAIERVSLALTAPARAALSGARALFEGADRPATVDEALREYPRLRSLLERRRAWLVAGLEECLTHFATDRERLGASRHVAKVVPELSDPHGRGRTVIGIVDADGVAWLHKPRDLRPAVAFAALMDGLAEHSCGWLAGPRPQIRLGDGHGWMEHVAPAPLPAREERTAFGHRLGALVALQWTLGALDWGAPNVVAHGAFPVLIDHETVLAPALEPTTGDAPLQTGAPCFFALEEARVVDRGAASDQPGPHRPSWEGRPCPPELDAILEGFVETERQLRRERRVLLRLLDEAFAGLPVRFLFRDTRIYEAVLRRLRSPDTLRAPAREDSIASRLREATLPCHRPLVDAELAALGRGDIPRFTALERRVYEGTQEVGELLAEAPLPRARRLASTDRAAALRRELALQLEGARALRDPAAGGAAPRPAALALALRPLVFAHTERRLRLAGDDPERWNLYQGLLGQVLFLAASEWGAPTPWTRQLVEQVISGWARVARGRRAGVSGLDLFGVAALARLLGSEAPLRSALEVLRARPTEPAASAELLYGEAGWLVGALGVWQASGAPVALDAARRSAEALCASRHALPAGDAWPDAEGSYPGGLAHGAAGVALALGRWRELEPTPAIQQALQGASRFQEALWSGPEPHDGLRADGTPFDPGRRAWCHGAPGVYLAAAATGAEDLARRALEHTRQSACETPAHLCCGVAGRVEVLRWAGDAERARGARRHLASLVTRGPLRMAMRAPMRHSLFQGLAGIGYALLGEENDLPNLAALQLAPQGAA